MQKPRSPRRLAAIAVTSVLALGGLTAVPAQAANPNTGAASSAAGVDKTSVIVQLRGDSLATSPKAAHAKGRVDLASAKTKSVAAQLAQQRNAFRTWLKTNAPKAKVTGEYDLALNGVAVRLNGTSIDRLKAAPGVQAVAFQNTYVPQSTAQDDPDLALIDAVQGWQAAGSTGVSSDASPDPQTWAGYGVKVGIIDTGIDVTHPCFDDTGYPATTKLGDPRFTNNKVIVARVFNNKLNQTKYTAEAIQSHGTHVAGTVACNLTTPAKVLDAVIPYAPSGVAPGALLGNYSVFPGDVENARTEDIVNAMEQAYKDGMDVINMSLGGDTHGNQDLGTVVVDNLDKAGMVVAVSAGNEGPNAFTTGSPGSAERALTAGASSVGHMIGVPISDRGSRVAVAAIGEFKVPDADLTAPLSVVLDGANLSLGCSALPASSLTGKIALISRGSCTFGNKVYNAEQAGAVGVIIVNSQPGDPISMAADAAFTTTIPAVMVALTDKATMVALDGQPVTIGAQLAYSNTGNANLLENFSSTGAVDVSYRIKPDVVAPGGNVLSSLPHYACEKEKGYDPAIGCWGLMSGTSMASPHLAGMAAVVLDAHHDYAPWQVRSAIVNTADRDGVLTFSGANKVPLLNVQRVGAGLADLDAAVDAELAFSRTSVSFGAVAGGAGNTYTQQVTVTNLTGSTITRAVSVEFPAGAGTFAVDKASVTLPAGGSATLTLTYTGPKKSGASQAHLYVGDEHVALYAFSK